ncbi:MAG: hypothetical protein WC284_08470 [Candidimonas sp.]
MNFDISKFRKGITKEIPGMRIVNQKLRWVSIGNYALNWYVSGDFQRGFPLGQISMFAGQSGSGKSFMAASVIQQVMNEGGLVYIIDTENAMNFEWLEKTGVDTDSEFIIRDELNLVDDCIQHAIKFVDQYIESVKDTKEEDRIPLLVVIDSLGMLSSRTELDQALKGDLKGDMGRKPKALKAMVNVFMSKIRGYPISLLMTNHIYDNQDLFAHDPKISGGHGIEFASGLILLMQKLKLKEDEDGNKISDVVGIRSKVSVHKGRFNPLGVMKTLEMRIRFDGGLDPYSGLLELFEHLGVVEKDGNRLKYIDVEGVEHKYFRKQFTHEIFDKMMLEYPLLQKKNKTEISSVIENDKEDEGDE